MCGTTSAGSRSTVPGHSPSPSSGGGGRLRRAVEEHLHADAHPEHRPAAGEAHVDDASAVRLPQPAHTGVEVADARHEQAVGSQGRLGVAGQRHLGADALEGAHGRADVAAAVVEDHDGGRGRHRSLLHLVSPARHRARPCRSGARPPASVPRRTPRRRRPRRRCPRGSAAGQPEHLQQVAAGRHARRRRVVQHVGQLAHGTRAVGPAAATTSASRATGSPPDGRHRPRLPDQPAACRPPAAGGHAEHRPAAHRRRSRRPGAAGAAPGGQQHRHRVVVRRRRPSLSGRQHRGPAPVPGTTASGATPRSAQATRRRAAVTRSSPRGARAGCHGVTWRGCPWRSGRPSTRASRATAARSARATALNWASTMWCGSRPASTRTCRAMPGVVGEGLEDVAGQRARVVAADDDVRWPSGSPVCTT